VSVFNMADTPRKESQSVVSKLEDRGIRTIMLTGDNHGAAKSVAAKVGLKPENVRAGLLPEDKIAIVLELKNEHEGQDKVGMVGDGVNDAPALAAADIGIAMGMSSGGGGSSASAVAMETADVVLMDSNLEKLVLSVDIGRSTLRKIRENFIVAIGSKIVMIILTIVGLATLWGAIIADVGAMLVVTFNGMTIINKYKLKPSGYEREISAKTNSYLSTDIEVQKISPKAPCNKGCCRNKASEFPPTMIQSTYSIEMKSSCKKGCCTSKLSDTVEGFSNASSETQPLVSGCCGQPKPAIIQKTSKALNTKGCCGQPKPVIKQKESRPLCKKGCCKSKASDFPPVIIQSTNSTAIKSSCSKGCCKSKPSDTAEGIESLIV